MEQPISDYLTKQVQLDRNVVTYRSLSRQFNIHVNAAKNNLAAFYAASHSSPDSVYATYMLTGEAAPSNRQTLQLSQDEMDVDIDGPTASEEARAEQEGDEPDSEPVPLVRVLLVGEDDLENAKAQFHRIFSQVVYSLSPAHLIDASLICSPSEKVHEADAKLKADASALLGRLVGPHVHIGKPVAVAPPPAKEPEVAAPAPRDEPKPATITVKTEKQDDKPKFKLRTKEDKPTLKPKLSGFLDWGKAKTKQKDDNVKEEEKEDVKAQTEKGKEKTKVKDEGAKAENDEVKQEKSKAEKARSKPGVKKSPVSSPEAEAKASSPEAESSKRNKPEEKRGVKRKSTLPTSSDEEEVPRKKSPVVPSKKSPIVSKGKERVSPKDEKPSTSRSSTAKPAARRKPTRVLMSDSDEEEQARIPTPPPVAAPAKRGKPKRVIIDSDTDESDDGARPSKAKAKGKARPAAVSKSLQAMMDIDDDEVIKASRADSDVDTELDEEEVPPETQTEDFVEDSEPERVKQRPKKKRQQKKPVPVGRNGLKKRRVVRTRSKMDEKGYMVTEDYSSYESVDEEVPEPVKTQGKGKKKPVPIGSNGLKKRRIVRQRIKMDEKGYMFTEDYSSYESVDEGGPEEANGKGKKGKKAADAHEGKDAVETKAASKDGGKVEKPEKKPIKARKSIVKGQGSLMNFFNSKPK